MPSEPKKKDEIHIEGNFTNSNIIIGDNSAISQTSEVLEISEVLRKKSIMCRS